MVYVSGGLSPVMTAAAQMGRSSGVCELQRENYQETASAALEAPIDLYVAFAPDDGMTSAAASSDQLSGLEHLSALTGNQLIRLGGTSKSIMERLVRETSAYYLLTFDSEPSERNNRAYRVELRTSREKTEIRAKPEVTIGKGGARTSGPKGPTTKEMLRVGTSFRELPLRAATYFARDAGDKLKLLTVFEASEAGVTFSSATIGLFDEKGKLLAQTTPQSSELAAGTVVSAVTAKPGTYRLRIAAMDTAGRRGAVDQSLRVDLDPADPVKLSTLVLGKSGPEGMSPTLQFGTDPSAIGYIEVYGVAKGAAVTATFELATAPNGRAVISVPASVAPQRIEDVRMVMAEIPIGSISPGNFELRVSINIDGRPVGRAARTLRKVLK